MIFLISPKSTIILYPPACRISEKKNYHSILRSYYNITPHYTLTHFTSLHDTTQHVLMSVRCVRYPQLMESFGAGTAAVICPVKGIIYKGEVRLPSFPAVSLSCLVFFSIFFYFPLFSVSLSFLSRSLYFIFLFYFTILLHYFPLIVLLHDTLLHSTLLYSTLLYSTLLYSTLLYSTLLYSTLLYSILYYTLLYPILYYTLLYSTLLFCALLFYLVPSTP